MEKDREKIFMVTNQRFIGLNILPIYRRMAIIHPTDNCRDCDNDCVGCMESDCCGTGRNSY